MISILTILKNKSSLSISFKAGKKIITINNKKQTDKNKNTLANNTLHRAVML